MTVSKIEPASDEEIAHGRIGLDEMYDCVNCPTERGGRCFRCSIHPAILARYDADQILIAELQEKLSEEKRSCAAAWKMEAAAQERLKYEAVCACMYDSKSAPEPKA